MSINNVTLRIATFVVATLILASQPLPAQATAESERLEKLERAVEQLQKRNAQLEQEISSLKKQTSFTPLLGAESKTKTKVTSDGKTYV
jgi:cell division protein FtsB